VGTWDKVNKLDCLRVDTGDFELDQKLSGYLKVWVDYRQAILMKVRC
jgi:predicted polyphosphate/ATP-dependent NAD kinase